MEKGSKKKVQDGLREREEEVQELRSRVTGAEASLQKAQADLQERTEEVSKLKSEVGELEVKHAELKVERKQLEQLREEKESHGAQQQTEISQVSHPQFHDYECVFRVILSIRVRCLYIVRSISISHTHLISCYITFVIG